MNPARMKGTPKVGSLEDHRRRQTLHRLLMAHTDAVNEGWLVADCGSVEKLAAERALIVAEHYEDLMDPSA